MTILVAVKTGTDLVIAADSKVTTSGIGGKDPSGNPILLEQTYDFGTKIAFSRGNFWTAAIAGQGSFGDVQILDIVGEYRSEGFGTRSEQDLDLTKLVGSMTEIRNSKFITYPEGSWPFTELFIFSSDPEGRSVRAWDVIYGPSLSPPRVNEILQLSGVYFAGSYKEVFTLLYGYNSETTQEIAAALEIPEVSINAALQDKFFPPIRKLNVLVMPLQDAIELANFLAKVQIQMERFLPGAARCGGPIDIAIVRGLPKHEVIWYPGKEIRHPGSI